MGSKPRVRSKSALSVLVAPGQIYRVPRPGVPARHVRIARVVGKRSRLPGVMYYEVTRSGKRKGPAKIAAKRDASGKVEKWVPNTVYHQLQWCPSVKAWTMGCGFELVERQHRG